MFGRKKKQAQFNTMDDSRVTVYDFKRRMRSILRKNCLRLCDRRESIV